MERGETLKDSEFYTVSEEWPQPPDEACTLKGGQTSTLTRPKKKTNSRVRKKLSESLAGVTAAAVAVVMVASALPTMKDIFEEDFFDEEIIGGTVAESKPNLEVGEPCPICGERNCPYYCFEEGMEGLRISYLEEPEYLEYDANAMNGFNTLDLETCMYAPVIYTETDERLVFRLGEELSNLVDGGVHWSPLGTYTYVWGGDAIGASGYSVVFEDEKSMKDPHVLYVYLVYAANGVCAPEKIAEELDIQEELSGLQFTVSKVEGIEKAEFHVYSDLGEEFNQAVLECCIARKITELDLTFTLGKTMRLREGTVVHRSYYDLHHLGMRQYVPVAEEIGGLWLFEADFYHKTYAINDMNITFAATSWLDLFAQWRELNGLATKYGHQVCFPLYDLGETSANGITYRCYATYAADIGEDHYVTYLVVPQQEQEILISFTEYCFSEEMEALRSGLADGHEIAEMYEIFSQITLR